MPDDEIARDYHLKRRALRTTNLSAPVDCSRARWMCGTREWGAQRARFARLMNPSNAINYCATAQSIRTRRRRVNERPMTSGRVHGGVRGAVHERRNTRDGYDHYAVLYVIPVYARATANSETHARTRAHILGVYTRLSHGECTLFLLRRLPCRPTGVHYAQLGASAAAEAKRYNGDQSSVCQI